MVSYCGLNLPFPVITQVEHLFIGLLSSGILNQVYCPSRFKFLCPLPKNQIENLALSLSSVTRFSSDYFWCLVTHLGSVRKREATWTEREKTCSLSRILPDSAAIWRLFSYL